MSLRRTWEVFRLDLRHHFTRPLFWILIAIVAFLAYGLSTGHVHIGSGDSDTGGQKAWITSEFGNARILALLAAIFFTFFVAVGAGMVVIRDDETKVTEVLHSTPLRAGEYVWGKFLAVLCAFLLVFLLQLFFHAFFNHLMASAKSAEFVGPFQPWNYLGPSLVFVLPTILLFAGMTFAIGARWKRPIPVFFLPVASPAREHLLLLGLVAVVARSADQPGADADRSLGRPLAERDLVEGRPRSRFYNHASIPYDASFLAGRAGYALLRTARRLADAGQLVATLRGKRSSLATVARRADAGSRAARFARSASGGPAPPRRALVALEMRSQRPGFLRATLEVARIELKELRASAGLYLFVPLILAQTVGTAAIALGAFDTPLLLTSGLLALKSMGYADAPRLPCCSSSTRPSPWNGSARASSPDPLLHADLDDLDPARQIAREQLHRHRRPRGGLPLQRQRARRAGTGRTRAPSLPSHLGSAARP